MAEPTLMTIAVANSLAVARATADPMGFVEQAKADFDRMAIAQASAVGRFATSDGSAWGLLLPNTDPEGDVASLREQFGDQVADSLLQSRAVNGPAVLIAWKVFDTVPKGWG